MKILIVCPSFKILGGVANHYKGLDPYWSSKIIYSFQGKRMYMPALFTLVPDFVRYVFLLLLKSPDVVIVNPSLRKYQLFRDSLYVIIARLFRLDVVTFVHGWDDDVANEIIAHSCYFNHTFGESIFINVLYSGFRDKLLQAGVKAPVLLSTTKVSNGLLDGFDVNSRTGEVKQLLFLARLELSKGILIVLETFVKLKRKYPYLTLAVCGTGSAWDEAQRYVCDNGLVGVVFHGNLSGESLIRQFRESDVYLLPTTHGEGMATSVLEAMAFGLPVITRPVGGVCDFFVNEEMGYLLDSLHSDPYVDAIEELISNPKRVRNISLLNHSYAIRHFLASEVTRHFEDDIRTYLNK